MPKQLSREELEQLLPDGNWIHCFSHPGHKEGSQWSRGLVFDKFEKFGAELGDENMKRLRHAIVIQESPDIWHAIENRTGPK